MKPYTKSLFYTLEEGDKILECDFIIYGQIGYETSQLTAEGIEASRHLKQNYLGKTWQPGMPEIFRIVGSKSPEE